MRTHIRKSFGDKPDAADQVILGGGAVSQPKPSLVKPSDSKSARSAKSVKFAEGK